MSLLCCLLKRKFLKTKTAFRTFVSKEKKENANSSCVSKHKIPYLTRDKRINFEFILLFFSDISNTIISQLSSLYREELVCYPFEDIKTELSNK